MYKQQLNIRMPSHSDKNHPKQKKINVMFKQLAMTRASKHKIAPKAKSTHTPEREMCDADENSNHLVHWNDQTATKTKNDEKQQNKRRTAQKDMPILAIRSASLLNCDALDRKTLKRPVTFCEFVENTNIFEIAIDEIMLLHPDNYEKYLKDTKPMVKKAKTIFKQFYGNLNDRNDAPLNALKLNKNCTSEFRDNYLKIYQGAPTVQQEIHNEKVALQDENDLGPSTSKRATSHHKQQKHKDNAKTTKMRPKSSNLCFNSFQSGADDDVAADDDDILYDEMDGNDAPAVYKSHDNFDVDDSLPLKRLKLQQECTQLAIGSSQCVTIDAVPDATTLTTNPATSPCQFNKNYVLAAIESTILIAAGKKERINIDESMLPVTLSEFIKFTNIIFIVKAELDTLDPDSHKTYLKTADLFTAIVNELYIKFYLDPSCRKQCVFKNLMIYSIAPSRILEFPAEIRTKETKINSVQQRTVVDEQQPVPIQQSSSVLDHKQLDMLEKRTEATKQNQHEDFKAQRLQSVVLKSQLKDLKDQLQTVHIQPPDLEEKQQVTTSVFQTELFEKQLSEVMKHVHPQKYMEYHSKVLQQQKNNQNLEDQEKCIAFAFCTPVEHLHQYESYLPVTLDVFKAKSHFNETIDNILRDITEAAKCEGLRQDTNLRGCIIQNYYVYFYMCVALRDKYKLRLKLCPKFLKDKILQQPDFERIRKQTMFYNTTKTKEVEQADQSVTATNSSKLNKKGRPLLHLSQITQEAFLAHYITNKFNDSHKMNQLLELVKNEINAKTSIAKEEPSNSKNCKNVRICISNAEKASHIQSIPRNPQQLMPVPELPSSSVVSEQKHSQNSVAIRLQAAERLFFQYNNKKYHTLDYLVRCCRGVKQRIQCAILEMSFEQFCEYTHVYNAPEWRDDFAMQQRLYRHVFITAQVWPVNLFIRLKDLVKFLQTKELILSQLDLCFISPKLLHWQDLSVVTTYDDCARLHYFKMHAKSISNNDDHMFETSRAVYYKACWTQETWLWQTPIVTDTSLIEKLKAAEGLNQLVRDIFYDEGEHTQPFGSPTSAPDVNRPLLRELLVAKYTHDTLSPETKSNVSSKDAPPSKRPLLEDNESETDTEPFGWELQKCALKDTQTDFSKVQTTDFGNTCEFATESPEMEDVLFKLTLAQEKVNASENKQMPHPTASAVTENVVATITQHCPSLGSTTTETETNTQQVQNLLQPSEQFTSSNRSSSDATSASNNFRFVEFPENEYTEMLSTDTDLEISLVETESKEMPKSLNNLQFNLDDETGDFECIALPGKTIFVSDGESTNFDITLQTTSPVELLSAVASTSTAESNMQTFCEAKKSLCSMGLNELSKPSFLDKKSLEDISNGQVHAKLLPSFEQLVPIACNAPQLPYTASSNNCATKNSFSASQALATDCTIFNSTALLNAVDNHRRNIASSVTIQPLETNTCKKALSSETTTTSSHQVNLDTEKAKKIVQQHLPQHTMVSRELLHFRYFNKLTTEQISKYELPSACVGQRYMQALVFCNGRKTVLHGNLLHVLLAVYPQQIQKDFHSVLATLPEYHFEKWSTLSYLRDRAVESSFIHEDLRVAALSYFLESVPDLCYAHLKYDSESRDSAHCEPISSSTNATLTRLPHRALTTALKPNILERMAQLKAKL